MLKTLALEINKSNYSIAAALLNGGFLTHPEDQTYGCVIVINNIVGYDPGPISGSGAARRAQAGGRMIYPGSRRPRDEGRQITFENVWYDRETFVTLFDFNSVDLASGDFTSVTRKPEPEPEKNAFNCPCEGECECCHPNS